jgi:nucleotide-binding universal stress UspA family protein
VYRRILLPLDGSDLAEVAIPHAVGLATLGDAEILLVQVIDTAGRILAAGASSLELGNGEGAPIPVTVAEQAVAAQREQALEYLSGVRDRIAADGHMSQIDVMVVEGSAGEALERLVAREGCDVVVMSTHGRTGVRRVLLGSVADYLVRHSPGCSVLLVDVHDRMDAG